MGFSISAKKVIEIFDRDCIESIVALGSMDILVVLRFPINDLGMFLFMALISFYQYL